MARAKAQEKASKVKGGGKLLLLADHVLMDVRQKTTCIINGG